jgi:Fe2+ or Zn2+ uptake regulation protein
MTTKDNYQPVTQSRRQKTLIEEENDCPHDEHDHGICLDCGKDITDALVEQAENASDARQDR